MPLVLVTHPGRQHSHQLAQALHESGRLAGYWTGVPSAPPASRGLLYRWLADWSPQPTLSLPADRVQHWYVEPLTRRIADTLCTPARSVVWQHCAMEWFDLWCASRLSGEPDGVVCYENAALHTFRAAKERGSTTILDAASFHYRWQDAVYDPVESAGAHAQINVHKDKEIALADQILTVSEIARKSYVEGGVSEDKVTAVPMGAELSDFFPPEPPRDPDGPCTFLFVGHAGRRKGTDTLLAASRRLENAGVEHRVQFAGDADAALFDEAPPTVERFGYLGRDELVRAMHQAAVLVLPSRHDSFGRVVVEAMATGLPVLVSEHVGAKDVLTEDENGWVVPAEDVDALAEQMQWCAEHPEQVAGMQDAAVAASQNYTWAAYRERVVDVIASVLEEREASARHSEASEAVP